jgi:lipoprotein Spr
MNILKKYTCLIFFPAFILASCSPHKKLVGSKEEKHHAISEAQLKKKYSTLLNVDEQKIESIKLYALIDDWYGTAYKYGGCDKNGIDCSNFVAVLYQEIYNKSLKGSSAAIFNQCMPVAKNELQEGDLLFFKIDSKSISHIGMYLQNNKFVHATTKKGVMIDDLDEAYYKAHFYKGGRLK